MSNASQPVIGTDGRRSDAPLIKHLSKTFAPKVGWAWQTLPLVEMPISTAAQVDEISARVDPERTHEPRLPFQDAVFDLWQFNFDNPGETVPSIHTWFRVCHPSSYEQRRNLLSPWDVRSNPTRVSDARRRFPRAAHLPDANSVYHDMARATAIIEVFSCHQDRFLDVAPISFGVAIHPERGTFDSFPVSVPAYSMLLAAAGGDSFQSAAARSGLEETYEADIKMAIMLALYLTICPEYMVERRPEHPRPRRHNDPKPWTYDGLPSIILLDPAEAPSGIKETDQGGTHASPRPHQRRGHWAELRHPRYGRNEDGSTRKIFVKPAWVGPREWIMEGSRYRVLDQPGVLA